MKILMTFVVGAFALLSRAEAADLPFAVPVNLPPVFTWTGLYAGTFAGYGAVRGRATETCRAAGLGVCDALADGTRPDADGFIGGSTLGFNVAVPLGLVLGIEGDVQFTRLSGSTTTVGTSQPIGPPYVADSVAHVAQSIDALGTVRGRLGYAFGPALLYATGGLALAEVRLDANREDDFAFGALRNVSAKTGLHTGYVVGGGLEYALSNHVSAKVEGLRFDLGSQVLDAPDPGGIGIVRGARVATDGYLIRAGLNYHLDAVPVASLLRGAVEPVDAVVAEPPVWSLESGLRYFYSTGGYKKSLSDNVAHSQLNSRLTYAGASASAGESFVRLDHNPTGLFVKGYIGAGAFDGGHLNDQDFPPAIATASDTLSAVKGGALSYADVDLGYEVWRDENVNLGAFVGYHYLSEQMNAYGCDQVGGGSVCAPALPGSPKSLSQEATWNAMRIGGQVEARVDRVQLSLEAAYLPLVSLDGEDRHWLRPDINPVPEHGTGDGYQVEATAAYALTRDFSIGAGGRYWTMEANHGAATFPGAVPSPLKSETTRYGGFVQASYLFR